MVWDGEGGMSKTTTLDEFFENEDRNANSDSSSISHELRFTGNWFIDAGILGFVNLMEEVYGWDLNTLKNRNIRLEEFYYAYFVYYIRKTSISWIQKQDLSKKSKKDENIVRLLVECKSKLINEIKNIIYIDEYILKNARALDIRRILQEKNQQVKDIIYENFSKFKDHLNKPFGNNKKTILKNIKDVGLIISEPFFQNLNFLNPSKNKPRKEEEVLKSFEKMIYKRIIKTELTKDALDKTISKFLFSEKEFPNIIYGKVPTIRDLDNMLNSNSTVFLLCFPIAFKKVFNRYILFYTPTLEDSYYINKKLKIFLDKFKSDKADEIFRITWQSVIDYLAENKAKFSLENMYIVEYESIQKQELKGVEYIGISKLQASILIEDPIREALNVNLPISKDKRNKNKDKFMWVLEEFIKNKPLYDLVSRHVFYCLREKNEKNIRRKRKASLYALAIDAKIKENRRIDLFSDNFLKGYRSLVNEIKDCYFTLNSNANRISRLFSNIEFSNIEERRQVSYTLVSALKKRNRIAFVNTLLKKFLENAGSEEVLQLNRFVFENIVSNDDSWENYGLALIIGILSFGGDEVGETEE